MKTTVIHHSADYDGIFCREIARKFLPGAELIGWNYGDPPVRFPDEGQVYVMDLSPDCLTHTPQRAASDLIWIDHHKSAIEKFPAEILGYRIDGVAACRLTWQWFAANKHRNGWAANKLPKVHDFIARTVTEPLSVRLAGEYDIWDKRDPDAELFQHGLKSRELRPQHWGALLSTDNSLSAGMVATLFEGGRVLQFARANEYAEVIQSQGFDLKFDGLTFLACCSHELDIRSHLFAAGIKPHHDALLGFTFSGTDWRFSLYHAPGKEEHDLSKIAVAHGGGGHRGACGFRAKTFPVPFPSA